MFYVTVVLVCASCLGDRISIIINVNDIFFVLVNIKRRATFVDLSKDLAIIFIQNMKIGLSIIIKM